VIAREIPYGIFGPWEGSQMDGLGNIKWVERASIHKWMGDGWMGVYYINNNKTFLNTPDFLQFIHTILPASLFSDSIWRLSRAII
jgi:hypothetical protein